MKILHLNRIKSTKKGTWGVLLTDTFIPICNTVENPWLGNEKDISCIPSGIYTARKISSPTWMQDKKIDYTYLLENTKPRSEIILHPGNTKFDTKGCILPVRFFGRIWASKESKYYPGGGDSTVALKELLKYISGDPFIVFNIRWLDR